MAADPAVTGASIPEPSITPTTAPGMKGPVGTAPRTNYSRVNTGTPSVADAGRPAQTAYVPKVGSVMSQFSMASRPRALNDMLKTAMESALSRAKIASEAKKQLQNLEGPEEEKKAEDKREMDSRTKTSSATLPTDYVLKLAAAADYVADLLQKESADLAGPYKLTENIQGAGLGPQALHVMPTMPEGPPHVIHTNSGQAGKNKPDEKPGVQKGHPQEHGATQMDNDIERAPGAGDPPVSGSRKNAASPEDEAALAQMANMSPEEIAALQAQAEQQDPTLAQRMGNFMGRNAANTGTLGGAVIGGLMGRSAGNTMSLPGQIATTVGGTALGALLGRGAGHGAAGMAQGLAGGATPYPGGDVAGMVPQGYHKAASAPIELIRILAMQKQAEDAINPAQVSAGSAVPPETTVTGEPGPAAEGKERVPANEAGVADMTRREAKSVPKAEMNKLLDEPMMSASHDNVLQQAFSHTGEAGAKVSSAHNVKLAAARALLQNLANGGK